MIDYRLKGKVGDWYEDDAVGGFIMANGNLDVCIEKKVTDADRDSHSADIQNGNGYYDCNGIYTSYDYEG